jgi:hypothetical protein
MLAVIPLLGAIAALGAGAIPTDRDVTLARWRSGEAVPDLDVRLGAERVRPELAVGDAPGPERAAPPACVADVCQARVEVPGLATAVRRPHRTELFATMLDRAGIEPFATIAWIFARTGLRIDWAPPSRGTGDPATWGSFSVRVRLRLDAMNRPALLGRERTRAGHRSWASVIAPRA